MMHVSYPIGSSVLMGSDDMPDLSSVRHPCMEATFSISYVNRRAEKHADELFAKLSDGGTVTMPMAGPVLGSVFRILHRQVRDQAGRWSRNTLNPKTRLPRYHLGLLKRKT